MRVRHLLILVLLACPAVAHALSADELLLIVNKAEPKGRELAEYYAQRRQVPDGRIVEVDVPPWNDIEIRTYEASVAAPVRRFIRSHKLEQRVKCLVVFYGVPMRNNPHGPTPAERAEMEQIEARLTEVRKRQADTFAATEVLAARLAPGVTPPPEAAADPGRRAEAMLNVALRAAQQSTLPGGIGARDRALGEVFDIGETLSGDAGTLQRLRVPSVPPSTRPAAKLGAAALEAELREANVKLAAAIDERSDPAARAIAREVSQRFGVVSELNVLQWQKQNMAWPDTPSALDSELSFVMWPGYPRDRWLPNLLQYARPAHAGPPYFMVARIDGPTPELTKTMIDVSIDVEAKGLTGCVVVDAGFNKGNPPFDVCNKSLLDFASLVQNKTKLSMVLDRAPGLMAKNTTKDIALYCGWYSLRSYNPPGKLKPGAVAYHIASLEMITLHDPTETGWCAGFLRDGAAGTLGAVMEPYLHSFPPPGEFFPLLMTGRLTLAEVYWKTSPLASWMQVLVGDPLYNPYKTNPPLKVEDLPEPLKKAVGE